MSRYMESRRRLAMSKVFQGGKIQVPSEIRRLLNIKDGDKLLWLLENGKLVVERA